MENALIAGTVRGDDSTGIFTVGHKMEDGQAADWFKVAADGYELVASKEYQDRMTYSNVCDLRAVIGHHRSATVGTVSVDNAHPFQEGPITLVHNGTLNSTYDLGKSLWELKGEGVEVDSHAIAHNLAEATDPADVIKLLDGAFTLIWHDARDNAVRVIRNDKRPLHMYFAKCEDTVLLASEAEMLHWLAKRNNFHGGTIAYPKPGELLTFRPGSTIPEVQSVPLYVPSYNSRRSAGWYGGGSQGSAPRRTNPLPPWSGSAAPTKVPEESELMLLEHDLDAETDCLFIPSLVTPVAGLPTALVSGNIIHPDGGMLLPAVVMHCLYSAVENCKDNAERWTVRPVAVRGLDKGADPMIVARLVNRTYYSGTANVSALDRRGGLKGGEYVPAAHGEWVPVDEWIKATADGCYQCGDRLMADEAEICGWVNNGSRCICPGCLDDNQKLAGGLH